MARKSTGRQGRLDLILDWNQVPVMIDLGWLAQITGKNVESLRRATAAGQIPGVKVLGEWRFHKDQIREWLRG